MNFVFKGKFRGEDTLPKVELPENAVKYKEPKNFVQLNIIASLYAIPLIAIVISLYFLKIYIYELHYYYSPVTSLIGFSLAFICIVPHELLHGICFPKGANVEMYYSLKNMMAFVCSTVKMTKSRFIFLSAFPSLILGILSLLIWFFIPEINMFTSILFHFGFLSLIMGCGDLMNIVNTIIQVPNGATVQNSGFHTYWYKEEK